MVRILHGFFSSYSYYWCHMFLVMMNQLKKFLSSNLVKMEHICFTCAPCAIDYVLFIYYKEMAVGKQWSRCAISEAKTRFSSLEMTYDWL